MPWTLRPELAEAAAFLEDQVPSLGLNHHTLVAVGRCRVEYRGRAESTLATGDRVVLIKGDGTLLIHNPSGLKPVNWQPPGCAFAVRADGDEVVLLATRRKPPERVEIRFDQFDAVGVVRMEDGTPLDLRGTEFDMRDALRARPHLVEEGFVPWERERMSERGPMDLYGEDAQGRRVIVEVKRVRAGLAEATQLWRYVERERQKRGVDVRGILVAPSVSERAVQLLRDHGLEAREVSLETLREDGVRLEERDQRSLFSFGEDGATPKQKVLKARRRST